MRGGGAKIGVFAGPPVWGNYHMVDSMASIEWQIKFYIPQKQSRHFLRRVREKPNSSPLAHGGTHGSPVDGRKALHLVLTNPDPWKVGPSIGDPVLLFW